MELVAYQGQLDEELKHMNEDRSQLEKRKRQLADCRRLFDPEESKRQHNENMRRYEGIPEGLTTVKSDLRKREDRGS